MDSFRFHHVINVRHDKHHIYAVNLRSRL